MVFFNNENNAISSCWSVCLGLKPICNDNYKRFCTRYLEKDDIDEYDRIKDGMNIRNCTVISVNNGMIEKYDKIINLIMEGKEEYLKLKSALYLYYDILDLKINETMTTIIIATIFETLLLSDKESNQRKKVAVRAACLIADGQGHRRIQFIANRIYQFYGYRNALVHDGKNLLELDDGEVIVDNIVFSMKTIIYYRIKRIVDDKIESVDRIKDIVKDNMKKDVFDNAFKYITIEGKEQFNSDEFLYFND